MFGLFGILIAFGHSVLAMSGEESLAQVNREIAHPKLKNLKRAAHHHRDLQLCVYRAHGAAGRDDHPGLPSGSQFTKTT